MLFKNFRSLEIIKSQVFRQKQFSLKRNFNTTTQRLTGISNKVKVKIPKRFETYKDYGHIHYARKFEYYAFEHHPKKPSTMPEIMLEKYSILARSEAFGLFNWDKASRVLAV